MDSIDYNIMNSIVACFVQTIVSSKRKDYFETTITLISDFSCIGSG